MKIIYYLLLSALLVIACGGESSDESSDSASTPNEEVKEPVVNKIAAGEKLFRTYCITCHGVDGKLGLNGAKDLTQSVVSDEERIDQITNGKGLMTPFNGILTEEQIDHVAAYTKSLIVSSD